MNEQAKDQPMLGDYMEKGWGNAKAINPTRHAPPPPVVTYADAEPGIPTGAVITMTVMAFFLGICVGAILSFVSGYGI
jgi:hypothetical protein